MINNDYTDFLNELNDQERSVFLYHIILDMNISEVCRNLKMKRSLALNICRFLKAEIDFMPLKRDIYQSFL